MNFLTFILQAAESVAAPATAPAAAPAAGGSQWTMWVMLILIFVVMWFFMIRPQRKQQKELQQFRDALKRGDKVVTVGGIYGTVDEIKENNVLIIVDKDVKIRVSKNALQKECILILESSCCVKAEICFFLCIECFEIQVFQWNPFINKAFQHFFAGTSFDSVQLFWTCNVKEKFVFICFSQFRMH